MAHHESIDLARFDSDGALQDTGAALDADTRGAFFRKVGVTALGVAGSSAFLGGLPNLALGASIPKSDIAILNFALTLEYLEAEFYKQAKDNIPAGNARELASLISDHEDAHVKALKGVLKSKAVKKPTFDFGNAVTD